MFMPQITVMVSQVHLYLQTHQVVYTEYVQLSVCQLQPNRVVKGEKRQGFHLTKDRPVGEISAHMQ